MRGDVLTGSGLYSVYFQLHTSIHTYLTSASHRSFSELMKCPKWPDANQLRVIYMCESDKLNQLMTTRIDSTIFQNEISGSQGHFATLPPPLRYLKRGSLLTRVLKLKSETATAPLHVKSLLIKMSVVEDLNEERRYLHLSVFSHMALTREIFDEGLRKTGRPVEESTELGQKPA